jgi:phage shock protein C
MKKLYRSRTDKKIYGICGGLAELFGIDSTIVRLAMVFVGLVTGVFPLVITYLIAAWIIPVKPDDNLIK